MRTALIPIASLALAACSNASSSGGPPGDASTAADRPESADSSGPSGQPITAPAEQWTWVPFANALCGNGAATGIGINLTTRSRRVLVYLEGGGGCWSDLTCYTLKTAAHFTTGYSETDFATESTDPHFLALTDGFFDRSSAANPFADYSYVFVPYCTGDLHAGDNVVPYPSGTAHHVGFANMTSYLARLVPTFPAAERVILAGSSAGGFGALYNWWQTQQAFGAVRVNLIDDSGTFMPPDIESKGSGESQLRAQWDLAATLPPGCADCATRLDALYGFFAQQAPDHRGALLSYVQDSVLPGFFQISTSDFASGLTEELNTYFVPAANLHSFTNPGTGHVLWFVPSLMTGNVTVAQFLTEMVTDDANWMSVN
ncbi:MAG TPA: pectin acetylesterase-family hydrolase [Polyangiaceae bacterium]|nr:pectin acetylesterase-family hydrolase [Polyangiaceae bacterium]